MRGIAALIIFAAVATTPNAAVITVDNAGSGDHTTIAAGAATASAGDTVLVKDGAYGEYVAVNTGGTDASPLVFNSENQYGAVLRGFDVNTAYITIDGFEIAGSGAVGIDAKGQTGLRAVNNRFIDPSGRYAVYAGADAYVAGNFMKNVDSGVLLNSGSTAENNRVINIVGAKPNIFFFFEGDSITIRSNYMWNDDPSLEASHFFTAWDNNGTPSRDILMENNIGFNVMHALESEGRTYNQSARWTFRNNLFMNTYYVGLSPRGTDDLTIVNNTFINCGSYPVWPVDCGGVNVIRNNVFAYLGSPDIPNSIDKAIRVDGGTAPAKSNNFSWRYTLYEAGPDGGVFMPTACWVNPDPFDTSGFDFSLKDGATLIDAGYDVGLAYDLLGNQRPNGSASDPGAYEWQGSAVVGTQTPAASSMGSELRISPVPVVSELTASGSGPLGSVVILDGAGHTVWQGYAGVTHLNVNLAGSNLQPGRYYLVPEHGTVKSFVVID